MLGVSLGGDALGRWSRSVGIVSTGAVVSVIAVTMATAAAEQSAVDGRHHRQLPFNQANQEQVSVTPY